VNRRKALKLLVSAAVLPALTPEAFSLFRGVHAQIAAVPGLKTLNPHQNATVTTIAELIIPQTDTPGEKATKVNEFIDLILSEWYDDADTARFLSGLADVDLRSQNSFGKKFVDCSPAQQNQIMKALDDEAIAAVKAESAEKNTNNGPASTPSNFFRMMKKLTLVGYYTSEVGFEDELHKSIIPAGHAGCVQIPAEVAK